jgi:hypothetical protein
MPIANAYRASCFVHLWSSRFTSQECCFCMLKHDCITIHKCRCGLHCLHVHLGNGGWEHWGYKYVEVGYRLYDQPPRSLTLISSSSFLCSPIIRNTHARSNPISFLYFLHPRFGFRHHPFSSSRTNERASARCSAYRRAQLPLRVSLYGHRRQ